VATYLDETPYTSEGPFANPGLAPNLDTYDLQRIEVLRGPQGTLYGSQALGGLLKYVTNAPDPTDFAASAQGGLSSVDHGGDGFDLHAMVNIPLSDDAALRVVGFDSFYPGYIDDPSRGLKDINGIHVSGGRASLLYAPTQNFSIRFNVLYQDIRASDTSNEDLNPGTLTPIYGNLIQERYIAQPEETKNELYNVTANWDLGFAKLLSSTSYAETPLSLVADGSSYYGALFTSIFGPPTYGGAEVAREPVYNFTQEFRLSSTTGGPLEWQVGAFFTHEYAKEYEQLFLVDPTTHQVLYNFPVNLGTYNITPTYRELAGFANLDYHITPAFDVAFGGRYSTNSQTYRQINAGLLTGADDIFNNSSQGVFTYSGDARWHWTPDTMLYARIATGFVPGGPNDVLPLSKLPLQYNSSTTINYEAGVKSSLFDDSVSIDVDVFDIDWSDIQIEALEGSLEGITNGGGAQSDGVEWNFGYVPLPGLTLNLNGSYTDARLVQALPPPAIGAAGALLPNVPMWASAASAGYERPLFGDYSGFVGASWRFSGARFSDFTDFGPRQQMPSYNMLDLRAGIETQGWTLTFYAKNVGNTIAFSSVDPTTFAGGLGPQTAPVFTPRTIGIELAANF
jgi:outer membrane receptor protein involved in Fe transport